MNDPEQIGPFRVLRRLGKGGMGVVYAVQDPTSGRPLALKLVLDQGSDPSASERFWREAELLARVRHRNVVRVHSVGQLSEGPYLLEELIEGAPLTELAQRGCPPAQAVQITHDLADAVVSLHAEGILHRDLKLSNVLLAAGSIPILLDFGISRDQTAETLTRTGAILGSPGTMAPEQALGRRATEATDVYGLGVVLYGLLTGGPPFSGAGLIVLKKVMRDEPPWPASLRPETPRELDAICRRAMAKEPEGRYPSAAALRDDLQRYLSGERSSSRGWRRPVAGGAALLAAGALLWFSSQARPDPRAANPTPTPTLAPTPSASAEASVKNEEAPGRLWSLRPEQRFDVALALDEESQGLSARLRMQLQLRVVSLGTDAGRIAQLEARLKRIEVRFSSSRGGSSIVPFDTSQAASPHPFDGLRAVIDQPFELLLDQDTGKMVKAKGLKKLWRRAKATKAPTPLQGIESLVPSLLSNSYMRRVFVGLHVKGEHWRERSPGVYALERRELGEHRLPSLTGATNRPLYALRGRAEYRQGAFLRGEFSQDCRERKGGSEASTRATCSLEFSPVE